MCALARQSKWFQKYFLLLHKIVTNLAVVEQRILADTSAAVITPDASASDRIPEFGRMSVRRDCPPGTSQASADAYLGYAGHADGSGYPSAARIRPASSAWVFETDCGNAGASQANAPGVRGSRARTVPSTLARVEGLFGITRRYSTLLREAWQDDGRPGRSHSAFAPPDQVQIASGQSGLTTQCRPIHPRAIVVWPARG